MITLNLDWRVLLEEMTHIAQRRSSGDKTNFQHLFILKDGIEIELNFVENIELESYTSSFRITK